MALFSLSELEAAHSVVRQHMQPTPTLCWPLLSEALGWEEGDVLLDINGYELPSTAAFADAYPELTDSQKFELTLVRDGREVVLRYRVK